MVRADSGKMRWDMKWDMRYLLIPVYEMLFYLLSLLSIKGFYADLMEGASMLQSPELAAIVSSQSREAVEAGYMVMARFYQHIIGSVLVFVISIGLLWAVSRYLVWQAASGERFDWKRMLRSMPFSWLWFIMIMIPISILFLPFYLQVKAAGPYLTPGLSMLRILFLPLLFLVAYYTNIFQMLMVKTGKGFQSIRDAFVKGSRKVYPLMVSYAVLLVVIGVLGMLTSGAIWFSAVLGLLSLCALKVYFCSVMG